MKKGLFALAVIIGLTLVSESQADSRLFVQGGGRQTVVVNNGGLLRRNNVVVVQGGRQAVVARQAVVVNRAPANRVVVNSGQNRVVVRTR